MRHICHRLIAKGLLLRAFFFDKGDIHLQQVLREICISLSLTMKRHSYCCADP